MKTKKSIKNIIFLAIISIISLFFINMSLAANTAKVSVETANLRETTSADSKILEQLAKDEKVEIIESLGDWYKVKAKGITGYLRSDLITLNEEQNETSSVEVSNTEVSENNSTANEQAVEEIPTETQKISDSGEIKLGKLKISEDTKLKIVPSINATDIIEVKSDEEVNATEIVNGWVCVETKTTKGWIRQEKLKSLDEPKQEETSADENTEAAETQAVEAETVQEQVIKTLYVNSASINLRKEASTSSDKLDSLTLNTQVDVLSEANGWSKVRVNGKEGYISSSLLSATKTETSRSSSTRKTEETITASTGTTPVASTGSATGSAIVSKASSYIGSKYVYGGSSPSGFDCSGFTSYIYNQFGISLNRTAAAQYSNGTAISKSELQPGDLVMFGKSGINHVGIYAGNGTIVHAANPSKGVTTDTINSGYYYNNYVGARRIVN